MESYPPLIIDMSQAPQHIPCCQPSQPKQRRADAGEMPISLTTVTWTVSFLMGSILLICGYIQCTNGTFECSTGKIPDISHVMGNPPLNKLYAIMLAGYAFNKQALVRAFHERLTGIASPGTNSWLVTFGVMGVIFGPCIGYWDVYFNMPVHCFVVALFVVGEVGYALTIIGVLNGARAQFSQAAQASIDTLVNCRLLTIVLGVITLGNKFVHADIDPYGSWIEWILFIMSFYIYALLSSVMPYTDVVVPEKQE